MTRTLSGIQPSGDMHLGNYLGAVRIWATEDQYEYDSLFMLADLHSLTLARSNPSETAQKTLETAMMLVACGLDPEQCTLFVQGHVHEHTELTWLLECTVSLGQLERMTQFKDKAAKGGTEASRAGLLLYPVLMAADILVYNADRVPVGEDQKQHLELTRDIAQRFNNEYGDTFVVPEPAIPKIGARVMDLQDPTKKMSKTSDTDAGCILLLDDPKTIEKKFKRAVTDAETDVAYDRANRPGVANLLEILSICTGKSPENLATGYSQYGPLKADVATAVIELLKPIQERYEKLSSDPAEMQRILSVGADKARIIARTTTDRANKNIGLLQP